MIRVHNRQTKCPPDAPVVLVVEEDDIIEMRQQIEAASIPTASPKEER